MPRESHKYICTNGACLAEMVITSDTVKFEARTYFSNRLPCPICSMEMYEVA